MGLQGPPYAVLSPLVTDPLAPKRESEEGRFQGKKGQRFKSWVYIPGLEGGGLGRRLLKG